MRILKDLASFIQKKVAKLDDVTNRRPVLLYLLVALFYVFVTFYYMTPQFVHCNDTVYGYGDNTGGPIWRNSITDQPILGGSEKLTNYPTGESTFSPVGVSLSVQSALIWTSSKIAGPVCGYNIVNIAGFVMTATVMFGFIFWLTKRKSIALLAGYAVSFAPYFQYKVGGHPGYGYAGILIAALWLLLLLAHRKRIRYAIGLGAVSGLALYWDPYFTLLVSSIIGPGLGLLVLYGFWRMFKRKESFRSVFRLPLIFLGTLIIMALPLLATRLMYGDEINSFVSGSRGDVMLDAKACSLLPQDYLIPANDNYFAGKLVGERYTNQIKALRHGCNPSEYTTSIPLAIIGLLVVGGSIVAWERINKRRLQLSHSGINMGLSVGLITAVGAFAALLALPPMIGPLRFPSFIMLKFVTAWRVLSREYIIVNIVAITLASILLLYFAQQRSIKRWVKYVLLLLIALAVAVQFQAFAPFKGSGVSFSFSKNIPPAVLFIRDNPDIKVLAAYPLDKPGESENASYYLTAQKVHQKPLVNSSLPNSSNDRLYYSLKDLTDPQTLPLLRSLGVDHIQINSMTRDEIEKIPGIQVVYYEDFEDPFMGGHIAVAKILPGPKSDLATVLVNGFPINALIMKNAGTVEFETQQNATILLRDTDPETVNSNTRVCFQVKTADPKQQDKLQVLAKDGRVLVDTTINGQYKDIVIDVPLEQTIRLQNGTGANMRLNNLGCLL